MRNDVLSAGLSLALHAALLSLAGQIMLSGGDLPVRIRVSLLGGGGDAQPPGGGPSLLPRAGAPPSLVENRLGDARVAPKPAIAAKRAREPKSSLHKPPAPEAQPAAARPDASASQHSAAAEGVASRVTQEAEPGGFGSGTEESGGSGHGAGSGRGSGGDLRAHCVHCPPPQYPRLARIRRWQGHVDVDVALGNDGNVRTAAIASSSGYTVLDDAALAAARRSRFHLSHTDGDASLHGRIAYGFRLARE